MDTGISVNVHIYNIKLYYWENWLIFITSIMVVVHVLYEKKRALTYDFLSLYTGWNHRWCLHGSFRFTDEKWTSPCARNREIVIKPLKRNYVFQNTTQTKTAIKAPDRNPFRYWIKCREENDLKKKYREVYCLWINFQMIVIFLNFEVVWVFFVFFKIVFIFLLLFNMSLISIAQNSA